MASTDREALIALFRSTGGVRWRRRDNWDTDAVLATWYGVEVNDQGRVARLYLEANNLQGPIPPELGNLSALQKLYLGGPYFSDDGLTGTIPKELGKLIALQVLELRDNNLSGPIPPELGNLGALKTLALEGNELTGRIPPQLGKLESLQTLSLGDNQLSGPIPAELGKLGNLQRLVLPNNFLTGRIPPQLGDLDALGELYLLDNYFDVFPRLVAEEFSARNVTVVTKNNPWKEPPAEVMERGMAHAAVFLRDLDDYGRAWSNRLKVVL
ncbi:unnamed protein product, partial [Ectocarpus fasciculatus]